MGASVTTETRAHGWGRDALRAMRARDCSLGAGSRDRGVGNARRDLVSEVCVA